VRIIEEKQFLVASAKAATPLDYTRTILEQASTIVAGNQTHNEKLAALSVLFDNFLDTDAMARAALGQHWSNFSPTQQKEFLALFRELLQRTYVHSRDKSNTHTMVATRFIIREPPCGLSREKDFRG
jgi:ABC-type transporter MlaC component